MKLQRFDRIFWNSIKSQRFDHVFWFNFLWKNIDLFMPQLFLFDEPLTYEKKIAESQFG